MSVTARMALGIVVAILCLTSFLLNFALGNLLVAFSSGLGFVGMIVWTNRVRTGTDY